MPLPRPTRDELTLVGQSIGLALPDDELDQLHRAVLGSMNAFDALEAQPDFLPGVGWPRGPLFPANARRESPQRMGRAV